MGCLVLVGASRVGRIRFGLGLARGLFFGGCPAKMGSREEAEGDGTAVPGAKLPSGCLIKPRTASRVTLGCKSH